MKKNGWIHAANITTLSAVALLILGICVKEDLLIFAGAAGFIMYLVMVPAAKQHYGGESIDWAEIRIGKPFKIMSERISINRLKPGGPDDICLNDAIQQKRLIIENLYTIVYRTTIQIEDKNKKVDRYLFLKMPDESPKLEMGIEYYKDAHGNVRTSE